MDIPPAIRAKMQSLDIDTKEGMLLKQPKRSVEAKPAPRKRKSFSSSLKPSEPPLPEGFVMVQSNGQTNNSRSSVSLSDKAPETWAMLMRTSNHLTLQPGSLVKLRILLRNESASWIQEWVRFGGFRGWLERIKELCEMEWREECRDDTLLYECVLELQFHIGCLGR